MAVKAAAVAGRTMGLPMPRSSDVGQYCDQVRQTHCVGMCIQRSLPLAVLTDVSLCACAS